jgi:hypothetical protein
MAWFLVKQRSNFAVYFHIFPVALPTGLAVEVAYGLGLREQLYRGFEARLRHGCMSAFCVCVCFLRCPAWVEVLRCTHPLSKEPYRNV